MRHRDTSAVVSLVPGRISKSFFTYCDVRWADGLLVSLGARSKGWGGLTGGKTDAAPMAGGAEWGAGSGVDGVDGVDAVPESGPVGGVDGGWTPDVPGMFSSNAAHSLVSAV